MKLLTTTDYHIAPKTLHIDSQSACVGVPTVLSTLCMCVHAQHTHSNPRELCKKEYDSKAWVLVSATIPVAMSPWVSYSTQICLNAIICRDSNINS